MSNFDDHIAVLSESGKLILLSLLEEAEKQARMYLKRGNAIGETVTAVAHNMALKKFEIEALFERLKKPPVEVKEEKKIYIDEDDEDRQRVIYFEDDDQLKEALQILMDKSLAWTETGGTGNRAFVQFSDAAVLSEAQSALRRKWDFVENQKRLVADVRFDNLHDYTKILEFMRRQGMLLEFDDNNDLDEDYDQAQEQKQDATKSLAEQNAIDTSVNSFCAVSRQAKSRVDPIKESRFRVVHARKRWK